MWRCFHSSYWMKLFGKCFKNSDHDESLPISHHVSPDHFEGVKLFPAHYPWPWAFGQVQSVSPGCVHRWYVRVIKLLVRISCSKSPGSNSVCQCQGSGYPAGVGRPGAGLFRIVQFYAGIYNALVKVMKTLKLHTFYGICYVLHSKFESKKLSQKNLLTKFWSKMS